MTARGLARRIPGARTVRRALGNGALASVRPSDFEATGEEEAPTGAFADLFVAHEGRLARKWLHYLGIYDRLIGPYREGFPAASQGVRPLRFLEIGVSHGGSLELWRKYLGPEAVIHGLDIDPRCAAVAGDDVRVHIGSQADPDLLASIVAEMGGIDVVLDDGSHVAAHQRASFDVLFPLLSDGGLYVVEDAHTAYWARYGGGFRRPGTFIEVAKGMVDGMHAWYYRAPVGRRSRQARSDVVSIQFFDSIVAIEKGQRQRPVSAKVGASSF